MESHVLDLLDVLLSSWLPEQRDCWEPKISDLAERRFWFLAITVNSQNLDRKVSGLECTRTGIYIPHTGALLRDQLSQAWPPESLYLFCFLCLCPQWTRAGWKHSSQLADIQSTLIIDTEYFSSALIFTVRFIIPNSTLGRPQGVETLCTVLNNLRPERNRLFSVLPGHPAGLWSNIGGAQIREEGYHCLVLSVSCG